MRETTQSNASSPFFKLPREIRDQVYELALLEQDFIDPWAIQNRRKLSLGLLRANSTIYHEAHSMFYALNRFDFTFCNPEDVALFLMQIGKENAAQIRHVRIALPEFFDVTGHQYMLVESNLEILRSVRGACTNVRTLTLPLPNPYPSRFLHGRGSRSVYILQSVKHQDTRLREIPSVQDVIIEAYEFDLWDELITEMQSYGWSISKKKFEAEDFRPQ